MVFAPNDPFKPSVQYGVTQITSQRPDDNDLYTSPKLPRVSHEPIKSWAAEHRHGGWRDEGWGNGGWGQSRHNPTESWDIGWGDEGWGHTRNSPTYPGGPSLPPFNAAMPQYENQGVLGVLGQPGNTSGDNAQRTASKPAWRAVHPQKRGPTRGSPVRHPDPESSVDPAEMPLQPLEPIHADSASPRPHQGHANAASPIGQQAPPSQRGSSYPRPSYRRGRSPHPRARSESVHSSTSPDSLSRIFSHSLQPAKSRVPPQSWRTASPPPGAQMEFFQPDLSRPSAPPVTSAIAEEQPESDKISPPITHYSELIIPKTSHPRPRDTASDIKTVSSGSPHLIPLHRPLDYQNVAATPHLEIDDHPALLTVETGISTQTYVKAFVLDTLPRQIYTCTLLRLPHMYFSRVTRIFEEAELSMPQIKQGMVEAFIQAKGSPPHSAWMMEPLNQSVAYSTLSTTWEGFIDSVLREWKTLNIISVLLLSAILTMLQLEGAGTDPLIRFTALLSMICALMSLLYGCMFIIRFGTMRKTYKAAEWANEAQRSRTGIFWNVWVLLAMPATWLAWSMILYIISIMSFIWRTGTVSDATREDFTTQQALAGRITVSVTLGLGLIYFVLILGTLKRYGDTMDRAWQQRINGWINDQRPQEKPKVRLSKPVFPKMARPTRSWATWVPDPNTRPTPVENDKEQFDLTNNLPSEHLKRGFEGSQSTNRDEFTSNWLAGQPDVESGVSLPKSRNPSADDVINIVPSLYASQSYSQLPLVHNNHVTQHSDDPPEIISTRPLLRPASPLQITVNEENGPDTETILPPYNVSSWLSDAIDIRTKPLRRITDTDARFDRSRDCNTIQTTQQRHNHLVYMTKVLCLQDTSAGINVAPGARPVINGVKLRSLSDHEQLPPDYWKELERDIRFSWTPDDFSPMHQVLQKWNSTKLRPQNTQMALCKEVQTSGAESLSIYSLSLSYPLQTIDRGSFVLPPYLRAVEIFTESLLKDDSVPQAIKVEWDRQAWVEKGASE